MIYISKYILWGLRYMSTASLNLYLFLPLPLCLFLCPSPSLFFAWMCVCVRATRVKPFGNGSRGPLLLSGLKLRHNPQGRHALDRLGVV